MVLLPECSLYNIKLLNSSPIIRTLKLTSLRRKSTLREILNRNVIFMSAMRRRGSELAVYTSTEAV